jgi:hypothetical protein
VHINAPVGLGGTSPLAVVDTSDGVAHGPAGGGLTCGELIDVAGLPEAINPALPLDDAGSDDKAGSDAPTDTEALEDAGAADDAGRLDGFEATSDGASRPALTALPHAAASRPIAITAAV